MSPSVWLVVVGIAYPVVLVILFAAGGGPFADPFWYCALILPQLLIAGVLAMWGYGVRFSRAAVLAFAGWVILIWLAQWQIIYMASASV